MRLRLVATSSCNLLQLSAICNLFRIEILFCNHVAESRTFLANADSTEYHVTFTPCVLSKWIQKTFDNQSLEWTSKENSRLFENLNRHQCLCITKLAEYVDRFDTVKTGSCRNHFHKVAFSLFVMI